MRHQGGEALDEIAEYYMSALEVDPSPVTGQWGQGTIQVGFLESDIHLAMNQFANLFLSSFCHRRMAMPKVCDSYTGCEVQQLTSFRGG
jgi:hypothetical protein